MRISPVLAGLLMLVGGAQVANAAETPVSSAANSRFTAGLGLEVALVGLSFGVRPELQYRLGPRGTVSHFRTSFGLLFGPEFTLVSPSIGYRAAFRQEKTVQPFVGLGWQSNFFLVGGGPVFGAPAVFYLEGGSGFAINERFALGGAAALEWSFLGERGPGLAARALGTMKF